MLIQALLFSKVQTSSKTSPKKKKGRKNEKKCTASKVSEVFILVNSVWERDDSICFPLKPIAGVEEVNYAPGTNFEMVEVWVDTVSLFDSAPADREPILRVRDWNLDIVRRLFPDNTKIQHINEIKNLAEDLVFSGRNLSVIEKLLQSGSTISYRHGAEISTLAHYAALRKCTNLIPVLQRCGVDLNGVSSDGRTPLHIAIQIKDLEIVKVLLNNGANPNVPTVNGSSPLHLAVRRKLTGTVVVLIENGADVNAKNRENQSPLAVAAKVDDAVSMEILLKNGVSLSSAATYPEVLIRAIQRNAFELAQKLLERGARANQKHTMKQFIYPHSLSRLILDETTPIHVACAYADEKMVQLLLDYGADPNAECGAVKAKNRMPISIAVVRGAVGIVALLLKNGATIYNNRNLSIQTLKKSKFIQLMKLLLEHGCELNVKELCKSSIFIDALFSLDTKFIDMLMLYGSSSILLEIHEAFIDDDLIEPILNRLIPYIFTDLDKTIEMKLRRILNDIDFYEDSDSDDDSDYDDDDGSGPSSRAGRCAQNLAKHLVKLTVAGKQIDESVIPFDFYGFFKLENLRTECQNEIEVMKCKNVSNTHFSFYNVLTKNMNTVSRFIKNGNIRLTLINYQFEKEFPQYGHIIKCRVRRADLRLEFSREGMNSFNWLVCRLPRLPHELKEEILGFLSIQDLMQLRLCFPSK